MSGVERWWAEGQRVGLELGGVERQVFMRRTGSGSSLTLLHGFPSSSYDWARVLPALAAQRDVLMCDFLGFGASEKPTDHVYSLHEQADLVEALWQREGISSTHVVAHDYAVSVAEELLARRRDGALSVELTGVHLLNGGIYPDLHRPQPTQVALLDPEQGPQLSALINEELFIAGLAPTFAEDFDASADSADLWRTISHEDGQRILHLLIRYMADRDVHGERWVSALEHSDVPPAFVWGMLDPVSGAHIAERIRERLPDAPLLALERVAHWPALEAPEAVTGAVLGA